jgi:hypothetical protein
MTVVPRILLDHVEQYPSQAWCPAIRPCALGKAVQPAAGQRLSDQRGPGPRPEPEQVSGARQVSQGTEPVSS